MHLFHGYICPNPQTWNGYIVKCVGWYCYHNGGLTSTDQLINKPKLQINSEVRTHFAFVGPLDLVNQCYFFELHEVKLLKCRFRM